MKPSNKYIAPVIFTIISVLSLIIVALIVYLLISKNSGQSSDSPVQPDPTSAYIDTEAELKRRVYDVDIQNDMLSMRKQIRAYIEKNYDQERKKPYLYEINLIMRSGMLVGMDSEPTPEKIMYNSKANCDGVVSDINFSLTAYMNDGKLVCFD